MGSFFEVTFSVLIFMSTVYLINANDDMKYDGFDRAARGDRTGVWFGPRLGRRSLQWGDEEKSDTFVKVLEPTDSLNYYYDQMPYQMQADVPQKGKVSKKVIFTPKLGRAVDKSEKRKYNNIEFTPRLGRKLPDKVPVTPPEEDFVLIHPMVMNPYHANHNSFTPRLGRKYNFEPRLGREVYESYPETQIRVARSINETKSD